MKWTPQEEKKIKKKMFRALQKYYLLRKLEKSLGLLEPGNTNMKKYMLAWESRLTPPNYQQMSTNFNPSPVMPMNMIYRY